MHTDLVVEAKCTIFDLHRGLRLYFDLYEQDLKKNSLSSFFLLLVLFRPICSNVSMHTDFVFHTKCKLFWLNICVRVYFEM